MKWAVSLALSVLAFVVAATPAVAYVQPNVGALRNAASVLAIAVVAAVLFAALGRSHPIAVSFVTALAFAALTPLASEHAPWTTGATPDVYAVQRDVNALMPTVLIGGVGVLMLSRRRRISRAVAALAGAGIIATILGAPGDLRLLALPFWWHVPVGVRTTRRLLTAPRVDLVPHIAALVTIVVAIGYLWSAAQRWLSGVGILLAPLLADGPPTG